nr:helix-turn-helix transcriptional regulator [Pseudogemmobacter faecipullorum]
MVECLSGNLMLDGNIPNGHLCLMTSLSDHIKAVGQTQAQFATALGIDQATVSKLCRRKVLPSLILAARIERVTGGKVRAVDWVHEDDAA